MEKAQSHPCGSVGAPGWVSVPGWERYPWLVAGFSTRLGGRSSAYGLPDEQNLGWTEQDDAAVVAANRRRFVAAVAGLAVAADAEELPELVTLRQFHSGVVCVVPAEAREPLSTPEGRAVLQADGAVTQASGVLLGIQTADCVPVLVADTRTRAVGAFHAGWRGTLAGIVERGVGRMESEFGCRPEDLIAAIGPAIRSCCFAVGEEVRAQFQAAFGYAPDLFLEIGEAAAGVGSTLHMDLHAANRRQLLDAGLSPGAISVVEECSACVRVEVGAGARRKYFSHRAERGYTGRMLSVIGSRDGARVSS